MATLFTSPPAQTRYVDLNYTGAFKNGSQFAPYTTIQAAIDDVPAGGTVYVEPGEYDENVVITSNVAVQATVHKAWDNNKLVMIKPTSGVPLTITNATLASLATYHSSGTYSDLVNDGAGPDFVYIGWVRLYGTSAVTPALELLGVKGDVDASHTDFLYNEGHFRDVSCRGGIYGRNLTGANFHTCDSNYVECYNATAFRLLNNSQFWSNVSFEYVSGDSEGEPHWGHYGYEVEDALIRGNLSFSGSAKMHPTDFLRNLHIEGDLDLNDTASGTITSSYIAGDVLAEDGVINTLDNCHIVGDVTIASGSGAITINGGQYMGALTDPSNRLSRNLGA